MKEITKKFFDKFDIEEKDVIVFPYGSRVYGTFDHNSDYDFIVIMLNPKIGYSCGQEVRNGEINAHFYSEYRYKDNLAQHKIAPLECHFLQVPNYRFKFKLNTKRLREEISKKSSNSFVKCKKKLIDNEYHIGLKSLFHSLRILDFGTQIAKEGKILDYSSSNHYWFEIKEMHNASWQELKIKYQPIFNHLSTEFRKLAQRKNNGNPKQG